MEVMMHRTGSNTHSRGLPTLNYSEDTAHTVEVQREVNEKGEFGSFGFTLLYERPPIVGTVVPGGSAEKAGLKKNEVVLAVNGQDTTQCSHQEVVSIIFNTTTPGVWLTVCEPSKNERVIPNHQIRSQIPDRLGFSRVRSLGEFSMSQSTPVIPRNIMEPRKPYSTDDSPPPKYSELPQFQRSGSSSLVGQKAFNSSVTNISPLKRKVLTQSVQQQNGQHSNLQVQISNGHGISDQSLYVSSKRSSPTPAAGAFTSASVLVLYIGPVEIPEGWSGRELSSRCLQECTRRLLSQRQEFIEAFLDVNLTSLRILNVSQTPLFKHKREELYYCGVCTNDEQYFGIVTRKVLSKSGKKSSSGQVRAHICHVFKVIQHKSVLILHSGTEASKQQSRRTVQQTKPKTIPITSSVTIINALQGLFTGEAVSGSKLFEQSSPPRGTSDPNLRGMTSMQSAGSSSGGSSDSVYPSSSEKSKKKLDVVDLRPSAFTSSPSHILTSTPTGGYSNPNTYVSFNSSSRSSNSPRSSQSKGGTDYPVSMGTPAYHQKPTSDSWYSVDSPKENHSRSGSWDSKGVSPLGYSHEKSGSSSRKSNNLKQGLQLDNAKKMSDDSSVSSLSDTSPSKQSFQSSFASRSRSPTPPHSLSYSSCSRSRSPSPVIHHSPSPNTLMKQQPRTLHAPSKLSAGLALEMSSRRSGGVMSPYHSSIRAQRPSLRRQGSETSVMELQEQIMSPYHTSLPPKNGPLTSSIGSVATLTTVADGAAEDPEECGRVGGWVANFDKLLDDSLGVQCLLKFLEKEHCEENILFWRDAQEFKEKTPQGNNTELQSKVKKIYDEYLASSSPHTVNIDDRVVKLIEERLNNPPLDIFSEAQEQIYQLMKMDCYPRFKKSDLVKECLLAEMTGKPLPIEAAPPQKSQESQYTGIWKKHREFGFGRSLFGRWARNRQQHAIASGIWGASPDDKKLEPHLEAKKGSKRGHKEESPRSRKSGTFRENRHKHVKEQPSEKASSPAAEEMSPEDHLNIFRTHKRNVFEVNLPNKVTKIMEVPPKGTVRDAIQPVLKKHGYTFDIMELRFANTFKLIQLTSPAHILIGQHIIVTKSKNTFIAAFPDVLERILPADGLKRVGHLFAEVLQEIGKLQNFAIYLEGSRVPLELDVDTSVLVGQKVNVKYLPGPCTIKLPPVTISADSSLGLSSKQSKSSLGSSKSTDSNEKGDMDDLISMIQRLQGDKLDDQRISPEPGSDPKSSSEDLRGAPHGKRSPGEMRQRSSTLDGHRKRRSDGHEHGSHRQLSNSKSIDTNNGHHHHHHYHRGRSAGGSRDRESRTTDRQREQYLKPPARGGLSSTKFSRTQSGSSISHNTTRPPKVAIRSLSPPAVMSYDYDMRERSNTSPPPPTSKPPPLPNNAKRLSGSRRMASNARWSGTSFKSTDSASSEDSLDGPRQVNYGPIGSDHIYVNRDVRPEQPRFFPRAHPNDAPIYMNSGVQQQPQYQQQEWPKSYQRSRPGSSSKASSNSPPMPSPPTEYPHPLDNLVTEAYSNAPSSGSNNHQRKPSWPGKQSHPLQTSRGPQSSSAQSLSSYPWHNAHSRRTSAPSARTAAQRRELTENLELMEAGTILVEREIEEYRQRLSMSDGGSSNSSEQLRTPLSPTTHTLILPDDTDTSTQRETFV